jgi:L-lysine 6-transaminase
MGKIFNVAPQQVIPTLRNFILADGFHVIIDLEKSHGSFMHDAATGKEILDFYSYFASLPIGHNHPRLAEDEDFQRELRLAAMANPANSDIYSTTYAGFVQTFAQIAKPEAFKYLFFVAGGALAVENALKTAFDWKVRRNRAAGRGDLGSKILHFREAFHGRSGYTMSLTNTDPVKTEAYPKFDWPRVVNPKLEFPVTPTGLARVIEVENQAVREIEAAFRNHPHDIAAIIIEPIQGEGGDNHFRGAFLHKLREIADKNEALLIFDEVQTGLGITGKFWAFEHFDVTPDIVAFGKKTQVCGIMVTDRIDNVPDNVFHTPSRINSTWGGNLVDMVRGAKYLEVIRDEDLVANAAARGEELLDGLQRLCTSYPAITNVRGRGLFTAFTLPTSKERDAVRQSCWDLGLACLSSGPTSIRFRPCLTVSSSEISKALRILDQALGLHLPKVAHSGGADALQHEAGF